MIKLTLLMIISVATTPNFPPNAEGAQKQRTEIEARDKVERFYFSPRYLVWCKTPEFYCGYVV